MQQFVNKIVPDLSEGPVLVWVHSHHLTIKVTIDHGGHEREQSAIFFWSISRGAVSPCLPLSSDKVDCGSCCLFILLLSFCLETGAQSLQSIIPKHPLLPRATALWPRGLQLDTSVNQAFSGCPQSLEGSRRWEPWH